MRKLDTIKGTQISKKRTICEVHREIYDIMATELCASDPQLFVTLANLLDEAFVMGIKLVEKLMAYKIDHGFDEDLENVDEIAELRNQREILINQLKGISL